MINSNCGKKGYDKKGARTVKNDSMRRRHVILREYHCEDCDLWHVTSQVRNQKKIRPYQNYKDKRKKRWR